MGGAERPFGEPRVETGEVDGGDGVGGLEEEEAVSIEGLQIVEVVGEVELDGG